MHDPDYRTSLNDWNTFVGVLTKKLIEIDELVPELPTKDLVSTSLHARTGVNDFVESPAKLPEAFCACYLLIALLTVYNWQTFRIHRDIRFSPDKTPYKVSLQACLLMRMRY